MSSATYTRWPNLHSTFHFGCSCSSEWDTQDDRDASVISESECSGSPTNEAFSDTEEIWESSEDDCDSGTATQRVQSVMFGIAAF